MKAPVPALLLAVLAGSLNAAEVASYDAGINTLTLPYVTLDGGSRYQGVVIRLSSVGRLALNDGSVGELIEYDSRSNTLRLPLVSVGNVSYPRVTLTNPVFSVQQVGGIVVTGGNSGSYTLDIVVSAVGVQIPAITLANMPKPSSASEFCDDLSLRDRVTQSVPTFNASWTVNSCTFNGTVGTIAMTLTTPIITLPCTATYTYR